MNEQKWKCLDGDCLFEDEQGNVFYSSPEQNLATPLLIICGTAMLMPVLMGIAFKLGGM